MARSMYKPDYGAFAREYSSIYVTVNFAKALDGFDKQVNKSIREVLLGRGQLRRKDKRRDGDYRAY